jgi:PPM family protein phosphatase
MTPRLEMAAVSDRGMLRAGNEDCVAVDPALGLAVLADGMGGHNAGEVASRIAVDTVLAGMRQSLHSNFIPSNDESRSLVQRHVEHANAAIYAAGTASRERAGMGTTIVVALWHDAQLTIGHVGDSRCYRLRGDTLTQLTRDHTVVQAHVDAGALSSAQARVAAARNILTRALGTEPEVEVDLAIHDCEPGDLWLLCSDGLTEMLDDLEIARVVAESSANLQEIAGELVRRANDNGGVDNVSVILARAADGSAAP